MGVVAILAVFFTFFHIGDGKQCYVCNSDISRQCGINNAPHNSFLKDSGSNEDVCYELTKIDPENNRIIVQRGFISRNGNDGIARMCLGPEDGASLKPTSTVPLAKPRNSSNRNPNTLSGHAWNNLQQSKILSKRSVNNPDTLLKQESESDETSVRNKYYNCTACTKPKCNWKQKEEDDVDVSDFQTIGADEELDVSMDDDMTTEHSEDSCIRPYTHFSLYCFLVIIAVRLI